MSLKIFVDRDSKSCITSTQFFCADVIYLVHDQCSKITIIKRTVQ